MGNQVEKRISVTKEGREFLAKAFGVGDRIIAEALTYRRDSELCQKIRTLALKRGGFVINTLAEVETIHDSDGYMRQYFPNGVMLEFSKHDGGCDAFLNGEVKKHWDNVYISEIEGIQNWAAALN